jgi:hypothetical protein
VWSARDLDVAHRIPSQALEEGHLALLDVGVEAQRAGVEGARTRRAYERSADPATQAPGGGVDHQSAALPPADRIAVRRSGMDPDASHDLAIGGERDKYPGRRVRVEVVAVVVCEQALQLHELAVAQGPVPVQAVPELAGVDDQPWLGGRLLAGWGPAQRLDDVEHDQPPACGNAEQAPQAAQPAT